jgi:hypothetical protein
MAPEHYSAEAAGEILPSTERTKGAPASPPGAGASGVADLVAASDETQHCAPRGTRLSSVA